jgi:membrane protein YqaA with SNARE-associated domain
MKNWFEKLHAWISNLATTKWGSFALFICAFADASFLPLPVTTFFILLILLNTRKIFKHLFFVIVGTFTGALAGYTIGHFAWFGANGEFSGVVQFLFNNIPGFSQEIYEKVHYMYTKWDFWILSAAAATPLPYGMFSVTSGVFNINVFIFLITTLISQGIKFLFLAILTIKLGSQVKKLMELNWKPLAIIVSISVVIAILVIRVL